MANPFQTRNRLFRWLMISLLPVFIPLAVVLRVVLRAIKPWVHVRFFRWSSCSLGIWAIPTEVYLCERDAGLHPKKSFDLFYRYDQNAYGLKFSVRRQSAVCNKQLDRMFRSRVRFWQGAQFLDYLNRLMPDGGKEFNGVMPQPYDSQGVLHRFPAHLGFTEREHRVGQAALRKMGIPPGAPFVCFHIRDKGYYLRWRRGLEFFFYGDRQWLDVRDSSIENYMPALERLTKLGYFCVRMGKYVSEPLKTENPRIIDYASRYHSDFLDVYLSAHCAFFIGHNSGMTTLPIIFRRPMAFVNIAPFSEIVYCGCKESVFMPKKYYSKRWTRYLTFPEIFSNPILFRFFIPKCSDFPEIRDGLQLEIHENSAEEIDQLVLEMHERLQGKWKPSEEDEALQREFLTLVESYSRVLDSLRDLRTLKMASYFLKVNRELLKEAQQECTV